MRKRTWCGSSGSGGDQQLSAYAAHICLGCAVGRLTSTQPRRRLRDRLGASRKGLHRSSQLTGLGGAGPSSPRRAYPCATSDPRADPRVTQLAGAQSTFLPLLARQPTILFFHSQPDLHFFLSWAEVGPVRRPTLPSNSSTIRRGPPVSSFPHLWPCTAWNRLSPSPPGHACPSRPDHLRRDPFLCLAPRDLTHPSIPSSLP